MDDKNRRLRPHRVIQILIITNLATLIALVAVILRQPDVPPSLERMQEMVEAQDWYLKEFYDEHWQQTVELVKLKHGFEKDDLVETLKEIERSIDRYDHLRSQWELDLDASYERLQERYEKMREEGEVSLDSETPVLEAPSE